jgi:CTP:molybdopterin cytidylyltransferase MocA
MTVAAVILAASPASALADAAGTPAARRIADAAWAGGATPVVVVASDPEGQVAAALATATASILEPVPATAGPAGQISHGIRAAAAQVAATSAALIWPARLAWADAETVTTLIEAHGEDPEAMLRPEHAGVPGWPVLIPLAALGELAGAAPRLLPDELMAELAARGRTVRLIDTGDPGTTHDIAVAPSSLPRYDGPPQPADEIEREWGAPAAAQLDDAPPAGPARIAGHTPAP